MTINEIQNSIVHEMSDLNDWLDKYEYLINLGKKHEPLGNQYKTEENSLQGCQSQVWIRAKLEDNKIHFSGDSDSIITRGILSLLLRVFDNQSPDDIANADLYFIDEIGLSTNLSPSRANGLQTIIKQLKDYGNTYYSNKVT